MSFILDALKKSENERQRQVGPSLADVPVSRRSADRPWWVIAVAALLVVNLGVLVIVLNRSGTDKSAAAPPARNTSVREASIEGASTPATSVGRTDAPQHDGTRRSNGATDTRSSGEDPGRVASNRGVHSLAHEADPYGSDRPPDMPNPHLAAAAAVPDGPAMVRPIDAPAVAPAFGSRAAQNDDEQVPLMGEVIARGTRLPELHLDIHVYSTNPAERFVFVNMRKYTEGQLLTEGPAVEKITRAGVVLNQRGVRFLLPRP